MRDAAAADGEEQSRITEMMLASGIAGQTIGKIDVKCVHAQLADHLCRSESNGVAAELLRRLELRGTEVDGNEACRVQCDLAVPEAEAREVWWYEPSKNKWKLRKEKQRRKAEKDAREAMQQGQATSDIFK